VRAFDRFHVEVERTGLGVLPNSGIARVGQGARLSIAKALKYLGTRTRRCCRDAPTLTLYSLRQNVLFRVLLNLVNKYFRRGRANALDFERAKLLVDDLPDDFIGCHRDYLRLPTTMELQQNK
jgi:hypothetical protein